MLFALCPKLHAPFFQRYAVPNRLRGCCFFNTALWNNADDAADKTQIENILYTKNAFYASKSRLSGIFGVFSSRVLFLCKSRGITPSLILKYFKKMDDKLTMISALTEYKKHQIH
jgi:hypothetical protein